MTANEVIGMKSRADARDLADEGVVFSPAQEVAMNAKQVSRPRVERELFPLGLRYCICCTTGRHACAGRGPSRAEALPN